MQSKTTIFDFWGQVFFMFGVSITMLAVFCVIFGSDAREMSSMFALGNQGLTISTMVQSMGVSLLITGLRYLYFTDKIIKNASAVVRTAAMLLSIVLVIAVFIVLFGWFPVNMWEPWAMFFLCFGISFGVSTVITFVKEKMDNRNMEEALEKLKKELK